MNAVVATTPEPQRNDPTSLLVVIQRAASDPAVDVDKFERLLAIRERIEVREAETAFNEAMVKAQSSIRTIGTDRENSQTRSRYATYEKLDRAIRPVYVQNGFSLSFDTEASGEASVRVLCRVAHRAGHSHVYSIVMPADGKGAKGNDVMTKTHATGSAVSYGMRYLLKMIFNVSVGEDDDDGNAADGVPEAATALFDKLDLCESLGELAGLKDEIKAGAFDKRITGQLITAYNARLRKLKAPAE